MSNRANTKDTGPTAKDAHSGGKTLKSTLRAHPGKNSQATNGTSLMEKAIKGISYRPSSKFGTDVKGALLRKPKNKDE